MATTPAVMSSGEITGIALGAFAGAAGLLLTLFVLYTRCGKCCSKMIICNCPTCPECFKCPTLPPPVPDYILGQQGAQGQLQNLAAPTASQPQQQGGVIIRKIGAGAPPQQSQEPMIRIVSGGAPSVSQTSYTTTTQQSSSTDIQSLLQQLSQGGATARVVSGPTVTPTSSTTLASSDAVQNLIQQLSQGGATYKY